MILVRRICKQCGRTFGIEHTPGSLMPSHCPQCNQGVHHERRQLNPVDTDTTDVP